MKNLKLSLTTILVIVVVCAGNAQHNANHNHGKTDSKMNGIREGVKFSDDKTAISYQHYLHIKTALVNSNTNEAQKGALLIIETMKQIKEEEKLLKAANKIVESSDIQEQRKAFSQLSDAMINLVEGNIKAGKIYKDFCPMALNGGAYWLSSEEEVRNPYFGDKMLNCGSVNEVIQ